MGRLTASAMQLRRFDGQSCVWPLLLLLIGCQAGNLREHVDTSRPVAIPSVALQNAAVQGLSYPMIGLGLHGPGYLPNQTEECWHWPSCCTHSHCPSVNATREWIKLGGRRLDTGFPFGDASLFWGPDRGATCGGWDRGVGGRRGHECDPHGIKQGIMQSGVAREDLFITIKTGFAGPMGPINKPYLPFGHGQADLMLEWLGLQYADLYLMHEGDLGSTGQWPFPVCSYPTTAECRLVVWESCLAWMHKGKTKACGVANWELKWLQELEASNTTLPAVVQIKHHLHQSSNSPRILAIKQFCDAHGIVFNGYSPLGRADWTRFLPPMAPTVFDEPVLKSIASRVGRSEAQVVLRWHMQLAIPTNPRSMVKAHMAENLDVFNWELSKSDMVALSMMPQCNTTRGDPFMIGDPEDPQRQYDHMIGPTMHC